MNLFARAAGILAAMACVLASAPASAGQDGRFGNSLADRPAAPQPQGAMSGSASDPKMRGRMTPQERRQLREDVQDASRNVYPAERQAIPERHRGAPQSR